MTYVNEKGGAIITIREKRVRKLLTDYYEVYERQFIYGDYGATDELIDLSNAITKAALTDKQRKALHLVYVEQLTQTETGAHMDCDRTTVSRHLSAAISKIALYV